MSAGDRWTEHEPVKGGDPISPAILLWLRSQGSAEQSALPWQMDPENAFSPEPAPDGPESEDVLANLLRAIENTDIASQFQDVAPRDTGLPLADNSAQPAETAKSAFTLRQLPEPDAGRSEATSGVASESREALDNLLRAFQSTDVAATLEGVPQTEHAEPEGVTFTQPTETVETPTTLSPEPEMDVSADLTTAALEASKASESPAISLDAIQSTDVAAIVEGIPQPEHAEPAGGAFTQPAETVETPTTLSPEPETGASSDLTTAALEASKGDESPAISLLAIQTTDVAATLEGVPQTEHAEPAGVTFTQPAETVETSTTLSHEPEKDISADLTIAALEASKADESPAISLLAIQTTDVAAIVESNPQTDMAEARSDCALPAETAEVPSTVPQIPQTDATVHAEAAPQVASKADEPPARPLRTIQSTGANLRFDGVTPSSERESVEIASFAPTEATFILESPVVRPLPSTTRQEIRPPKRAARRRQLGRQRLDYLLSIAAPVAAQPPDAVRSEPAKPLPVVAPVTIAEPERPSTAGLTIISDAPRLPAVTDDSAPKTPLLARIGTEIKSLAATGELINDGLDRAEMHLENWFQKWFGPLDPRRSTRVDRPPLVAFHWIVDAPQALKIADISAGGLHLVTKDRWSEGNIISMTLQRTDKEKGSPESWIAVDFLVMRWCDDGMAGAFMPSAPGLVHTVAGRAGNCADKKTLEHFVNRLVETTAHRAAATR